MRILIIDDDTELTALLTELLEREGFGIELAHDGLRGLEMAERGGFDLVVLDLMLPEMSGFEVLKNLRGKSGVPVLVLTARGDGEDRIVGLETGRGRLSCETVQSARTAGAHSRDSAARGASQGRIEVNGVTLDPGTREVYCDQRRVEITTLEFDILELLIRAAGKVVSRDALMEKHVQPQVHAV